MNNKIKSLMVLNGLKQIDIARQLDVSAAAVSRVISGLSTSARIERAIAKLLNMRKDELWRRAV